MYINYDCDDLDQCYGKVSIGCSKLLKCQQRNPTIAHFLLNYNVKPTHGGKNHFKKVITEYSYLSQVLLVLPIHPRMLTGILTQVCI